MMLYIARLRGAATHAQPYCVFWCARAAQQPPTPAMPIAVAMMCFLDSSGLLACIFCRGKQKNFPTRGNVRCLGRAVFYLKNARYFFYGRAYVNALYTVAYKPHNTLLIFYGPPKTVLMCGIRETSIIITKKSFSAHKSNNSPLQWLPPKTLPPPLLLLLLLLLVLQLSPQGRISYVHNLVV